MSNREPTPRVLGVACAAVLGLAFCCSTALAEGVKDKSLEELLAAYQKNPRDIEVAMELGIRYHDAMRDAGRDKAYERRRNRKNLDLLHKLTTKYLKRAQFMTRFAALPNAYIGSMTVLRGRDVSYSGRGLLVRWRAPKNFSEGAQMIDRAVKQDPENVDVRLVRVADVEHVHYHLTPEQGPEMLQKRELRRGRMVTAIEDLELILAKCAEDRELARRFSNAELHFRAGRLAKMASDFDKAREHLQKAIQLGGNSDVADEARDLLEKLPSGGPRLDDDLGGEEP